MSYMYMYIVGNKMFIELKLVDDWFEANKLSLNFDHLLGTTKEDELYFIML